MAEYIDRDEVIAWIWKQKRLSKGYTVMVIQDLPAADVEPVRHGRWVTHYRSGTTVAEGYVSTCCDMWNNRKSDFCPNCGARMDGEK